ncbi:MAG: 3-isopropylmalate dehydratase small subunit [Opitutales bacterium]
MALLEKITEVTGRAVCVPGDDIDTDRIIPARFMKCVTFDGLGEFMFHDVRKREDGSDKDHPLNDPRFAGASILISGNNFGCGSSREHAPQAIHKAGFRAIIAEGFAEIFFGNSTNLGIPCVAVSREDGCKLRSAVEDAPETEVTVDVVNGEVRFGNQTIPCTIREGARHSLVEGKWDPLMELVEGGDVVDETATRLPYTRV